MEQWQSRSTFVLALASAAIGLGNVWRFGFLLGDNGGAPFMLAYVIALLVLAVPILVAEVALGALGRGAPLETLRTVAERAGRSTTWTLLAPLALLTGLLLLIACAVLASWALAYAFHHQLGSFAAISLSGTEQFFNRLVAQPLQVMLWVTVALLPLLVVGAAGVRRGLGVLVWLGVPLVAVQLYLLLGFAATEGDFAAAAAYLFRGQLLDFSAASVQLAFVHALFTLSIGVAVGVTFGACGPARLPLLRSVLAVGIFDVLAAVVIATAVHPLLFASNVAPTQGLGLLFVALPYAFGNLNLGDFFGALFFFAVYVLTLTSAAALLEPLLATLQQLRLNRVRATLAAVGAVWVLTLIATWSLAEGSLVAGLFASVEALVALLLLPLGTTLLAVFAGWRMPRALLREALAREPDFLFSLWYFLLRFAVPPALLLAWLGVFRIAS